jgi:hypothetical protein
MSEATDSPSPAVAATAEKPVAEAPAKTSEADKPTAASAPEKVEAPEKPAEPPFTTDFLQSSTSRFTHKAWHLYHNSRNDMVFLRETPVRATLQARSVAGAEELKKLLMEAGVRQISQSENVLSLTGTFEMIQTVIRHPQTHLLDAVKL